MRVIAEEVQAERGGEAVFSGVRFSVCDGESLIVSGPNGSGKSTLLRAVAGLLPLAAGRILLEGGGDRFASVAAASHYLGHLNGMKAALSVAENLQFWRDFRGDARLSVTEALDQVELGGIAHLPFGYLSAGQRRRAAIAGLLVSHRPVWLLDEPTAGLDGASAARFSALMRSHLDAGGIILAATHLPLGIEGAELRMGDNARALPFLHGEG